MVMNTHIRAFAATQKFFAAVAIFALLLMTAQGLFIRTAYAVEDLPNNYTLKQWSDVSLDWITGILNDSKSNYAEGEVVPFLLDLDAPQITEQAYTFSICRGYDDSTVRGYLNLAAYNTSRNPDIPAAITSTEGPISGINATIDTVTEVGSKGACGAGDLETIVDITVTGSPAYVLWGGYLATPIDAGEGNSAGNFSGGSLHMKLESSNKDLAIQPSSIIPQVSGCTDSTANNYDADANYDDGSCTYDPTTGTLVIEKTVVGSAAAPETFSFIVNAGASQFFEADGQNVLSNVATGTYSIVEDVADGFATTYANDVNENPTCANLLVVAGATTTCSITNTYVPEKAFLKVVKNLTQDNGGTETYSDFSFAVSGDLATTSSWSTDTVTYEVTPGGTYSVEEDVTAIVTDRYNVTYANDATSDLDCQNLLIDEGETVTCTVTNDDIAPIITVKKEVVNGTNSTPRDPEDFDLVLTATEIDGTDSEVTFQDDGTGSEFYFAAGTFAVTEPSHAGYDMATTGTCSGTADLGETYTCTVTNTYIEPTEATINFVKVVEPNYRGTATESEFSFAVTGDESHEDIAHNTSIKVGIGSYSVTEEGPAGYKLKSYSPFCSSGTFDIAQDDLGSEFTCTITNEDIQPELTVIKIVENDNTYQAGTATSSDFTMNVSGTNVSDTGFAGALEGVLVTLDAGSYEVTEDVAAGYTATYSSDCDGTIAVGEKKTCTITNNDISPTEAIVTVNKILKQDYGGDAATSSFSFTVNGGTPVYFEDDGSNQIVLTSAGTYKFEEVFVPGYETSYFGCTIDAELGAAYSCTITNKQLPQCSDGIDNDDDTFIDFAGGDPGCESADDNDEEDPETSITISKVVTGENADADQSFGFDFSWTEPLLDLSLSANDEPFKAVVTPGQGLVVTESLEGLSRWDIESIVCSSADGPENDLDEADDSVTLNLSVGEQITCVFTNHYTPRDSGGNDENIVIKKEVTAGSDTEQQFGFDASWFDAEGTYDFLLKAGGKFDSGDLAADEYYSVTEDLPEYWSQESVVCESSKDEEREIDPGQFLLLDGETITCTFTNDQELFEIYGYIWNDVNKNGVWDGFSNFIEGEGQEGSYELPLPGWTVRAANGGRTLATTTDADGYYSFTVPAGTWTLSETVQASWTQTFPAAATHSVTVPELAPEVAAADEGFFAAVVNFIVPTVYAVVFPSYDTSYGAYDFGNVYTGGTGGGGGGGGSALPRCDLFDATRTSGEVDLTWETRNGTRVVITADGTEVFESTTGATVDAGSYLFSDADSTVFELTVYRGTRHQSCTTEILATAGPTPLVLGEQVSAVPYGAPDTGAGGAAPVSVVYYSVTAALLRCN